MIIKVYTIKDILYKAGRKDYSKLVRQVIINKRGNKQTVYRRVDKPIVKKTASTQEILDNIKYYGRVPLKKVFTDRSENKVYYKSLFWSIESLNIPTTEISLSDIKEVEAINGASINSVFLLKRKDGKKFIYKPAHMEHYEERSGVSAEKLKFSQFAHEGLYYKVASLLGVDYLFPKTSIARIGDSYGALIEYIDDKNYKLASKVNSHEIWPLIQQHPKDYAIMTLLDFITGNLDRHEDNYFVNVETGEIKGIDHGLAFEATAVWHSLKQILGVISNPKSENYNNMSFKTINSKILGISDFIQRLKENKDKIIKLVETTIPATVYSSRNPNLDKEIIDTFKKKIDMVVNAPEDKIPISTSH
jgi:hypothetical protein